MVVIPCFFILHSSNLHIAYPLAHNKKGGFMSKFIIFLTGAFGYGLIEILWRGRTHFSMLLAGGVCFCGFAYLGQKLKRFNMLIKAVAGSAFVTFVELVFGIFFNLILKQNVWNYSARAFNFKGQICLLYSLYWAVLSVIFIPLAQKVNNRLQNK